MSNVQFDEGGYGANRFESVQGDTPRLVRLVLRMGLVKDESQANYVLIGVAVVSFIVAFFIVKNALAFHPPPQNQNVILMKTAKTAPTSSFRR